MFGLVGAVVSNSIAKAESPLVVSRGATSVNGRGQVLGGQTARS